jgi:hypothetical protein
MGENEQAAVLIPVQRRVDLDLTSKPPNMKMSRDEPSGCM